MAVATEAHNAWNFSGLAFLPTLQGHVRLVAVCGVGYRQPGLNRFPRVPVDAVIPPRTMRLVSNRSFPGTYCRGGRETENTDPRGNDPDG